MFKVPAWGNDIPKDDGEVIKVFTKKNKKKSIKNNIKAKSKVGLKIMETYNKKKTPIKKRKNGVQSHINLSKDDHIKNRMLRKNLKATTAAIVNNEKTKEIEKTLLNGNDLDIKMEINKRKTNKMMKKKGKVTKLIPNNESKISTKINDTITEQNNNRLPDKKKLDKKPLPPKRKHAINHESNDETEINNVDMKNLSTDEPDIILVNAKRKKLCDNIKNDDVENLLFGSKDSSIEDKELKNEVVAIPFKNKVERKKDRLKTILQKNSNRNLIIPNSNKLRERMLERLKAAQFRYLNEKLYTSSGLESQELFKSDPVAFQTYHEGYQLQMKKWPVNPLDLIVKRIQNMPKTHLVADMGCGEAALSKRVSQSVRSFDLVATAPGVEACNMAHTPLLAASMDVVVFCLALMGTDLTQYLLEANRVLKIGGHLLIAEVESRFENVDSFTSDVQRLGFSLKKLDETHKVFFFMEFNKLRDPPAKKGKLPTLSLKPCLYKKR